MEQSISLFIKFLNVVFKRLKHFVNHFWFRWYIIQQPFTKIFNLLHTLVKIFFIFCLTFVERFDGLQGVGCKTEVGSFRIDSPKMLLFCIHLVKKFFIFCWSFVVIFDGPKGVGCKTGVRSFEIDSSNMLLFCSTNLTVSKACINSAFLSL